MIFAAEQVAEGVGYFGLGAFGQLSRSIGFAHQALCAIAVAFVKSNTRERKPATCGERLVAAETRRTMTALALHGLRVDGVIANRLVPRLEARADADKDVPGPRIKVGRAEPAAGASAPGGPEPAA